MNKETVKSRIAEIGIIPAIRLAHAADALFAAEAMAECGIPIAEVTMTIPGALDVIAELARHHEGLIVGAGTVVDVETAQRCLDAGAMFLSSPGLNVEVVELAIKHDVVVFPGVLTPSEIMSADRAGSDFVKVFPCSVAGGPAYIKAVRAPFPNIKFIASGGVTQGNTTAFLQAGAVAVGIGRDLVNPEAVRRRERDWIRELAKRMLQIVAEARG